MVENTEEAFISFDIKVVNLKETKDCTPVDRTTVYGNPFPMKHEGMRETVCKEYEVYFYDRLVSDTEFRDAVEDLVVQTVDAGYIRLGCWCAPLKCHANTIAKFINKVLNEEIHHD